jgi:hypothetical protein
LYGKFQGTEAFTLPAAENDRRLLPQPDEHAAERRAFISEKAMFNIAPPPSSFLSVAAKICGAPGCQGGKTRFVLIYEGREALVSGVRPSRNSGGLRLKWKTASWKQGGSRSSFRIIRPLGFMLRFPSSQQAVSPGLPSRTIIRSTAGSLPLLSRKGVHSTGRE